MKLTPTTPQPTFISMFKPLYDSIVQGGPSVADAVGEAVAFEDEHELMVPRLYVSTAITSAGYKRDTSLDLSDVISRNNTAAGLVMWALVEREAPHIDPTEVMLPTELGTVPGWCDSDYLLFCFAWLSGLSASGSEWLMAQLSDPVYEPIVALANDRRQPNEVRWPHYRVFAEVALAKLALAESRKGGKRADGAEFLLQLIDTQESLGCRAEEIYADVRGLDRLSPTFAADLGGPLGAAVRQLSDLGASVGRERRPVELVPVLLR